MAGSFIEAISKKLPKISYFSNAKNIFMRERKSYSWLFKEYCPEIKALMFEKKVCFQKIQNIIFQLIIYDSLKEFDFHSQVNLRTRLRGKKKLCLPALKKKKKKVCFF